jgi:hypothetical protein
MTGEQRLRTRVGILETCGVLQNHFPVMKYVYNSMS